MTQGTQAKKRDPSTHGNGEQRRWAGQQTGNFPVKGMETAQ